MSHVLDLSCQALIEPLLQALHLQLSEYTFANLYLFRKRHEYLVIRTGNGLFIKGKAYDGTSFLMPTAKQLPFEELAAAYADCFFPIPEEWLSSFDGTYSFLDMDSDYLFERMLFATYPGRHLSKKRNLVRQFLDAYGPCTVRALDTKMDGMDVLEKWKSEYGEADFEACKEALLLYKELHLEGYVYYSNEMPVGLIIGESAGPDLFTIHFAKADRAYKGIYQYLYQDFAGRISQRWVNMEQDLGNPELRQAKHSYQPTKILKKYRVFKK